ncbi:MAG: electron transport complex subunit RsxC [Oscillospiraceae bacterium]|nr:electron transport complex subunit RsxC [Oscillospiraceae bacterium]
MRKAIHKFRGGAHVPHHKDTAELESVRMPAPATVVLPMQQHIGAPCTPTVKVGDQVFVGQVIGDSDAFVSAPIHAPISGTVKAIGPFLLSRGVSVEAIHIESDGQETLWEGITKPEINNKADFLKAVRASGLVGIGGAGFPTHVKLNIREGVTVDTLVINGAECEPYITSDYREVMENADHIINGIRRVMEYTGIPNALIGIENNKPKAIALLAEKIVAGGLEDRIQVVELPSHYPYGAEKMLVYATTGRTVPLGGLPHDVGVVMVNISGIAILDDYLDTGIPLIRKRVTVAGKAIARPSNLIVPIGTSIQDVVDFCGGYNVEPDKIVAGGPMMGAAKYDGAAPIKKQDNSILCMTSDETFAPIDEPCIRCGRCVDACPMSLMPTMIERYARLDNPEMLKKLNASACMECGSCAFECPARRPLVQYLRQGKQVERKAVAK